MPLSAFVTAMIALKKSILSSGKIEKIKQDIKDVLNEYDTMLLVTALPGCDDLFLHPADHQRRPSLGGKETVMRLQYAIRRLLKAICANLNGVILFIDDLQVSRVRS